MSEKPNSLEFAIVDFVSSLIPLFVMTFPFFAILLYVTKTGSVLSVGECITVSISCSIMTICIMRIFSNILEKIVIYTVKNLTEEEDNED